MRISDSSKLRDVGRSSSKKVKSDGGGFSQILNAESAEETVSTGATVGMSGVSGLYALQEVDDAATRASKAKLRAEDLLDCLDELKLALIGGRLSEGQLRRLNDAANTQREQVDDPALAAVLDEVDLRAQVEIAKLSQAKKLNT